MGICVSSCASCDDTDKENSTLRLRHHRRVVSVDPTDGNSNTATVILHLRDGDVVDDDKLLNRINNVSTSLYSHQGCKGLNQDAAVLYQGFAAEDGVLCAVFDGHGYNGHIVSKFVRDELPVRLLDDDCGGGGLREVVRWEMDLARAFMAVDKEISVLRDVDCSVSGSTAVVAVKQGDDLIIANLGDSRAVLVSRTDEEEGGRLVTHQLTTDMKPTLPDEADRIRKSNGRVFALDEEPHVQRVWMPEHDYPGLAMTRTFGDFDLKRHGVVSVPAVSHRKLRPNVDVALVLATDGVWDVLSNDEVAAAAVCGAVRSEEEAAKKVVEEARAAWKRKFPKAKVDDCTVACLFFDKLRD